jgi:hypothetical protein
MFGLNVATIERRNRTGSKKSMTCRDAGIVAGKFPSARSIVPRAADLTSRNERRNDGNKTQNSSGLSSALALG